MQVNQHPAESDHQSRRAAVGDLDREGHPDLIAANSGTALVTVFLANS
jgi:hypothetical protein